MFDYLVKSICCHLLIGIAPEPAFTGFGRDDNRVRTCPEMPGSVFIGRRIATKRNAASLAGSQVYPRLAGFDTFFTNRIFG
jgi:hypothetical protein